MKRTIACADCGASFDHEYVTGRPPRRCEACTAEARRLNSIRRTRKYRDADPQRSRDQWNRYNRKRLADPEHLRWKREDALRRAYGITQAEYDALHAAQGGVCAICGNGHVGPGKKLHVDHCHDSKRVRGLLCSLCNTAIGLLGDNPERADALAAYLRR
jgi:hypothetical protein